MSDWPNQILDSSLACISSWSAAFTHLATGAPASTAWPSANAAYFVPFSISSPFVASKMVFGSGTTAGGNCDVGIYDQEGNRLVSSGATARGASNETICNITDTLLYPDIYYMAMAHDGTSNIIGFAPGVQRARLCGVLQMATAYVLPDPVTFAAVTVSWVPSIAIYGAGY